MPSETPNCDYDFIIVGSGFGGSVSALRLTEKGYRVAVMEMGRRWTPENLPRTSWSLRRWFWRPSLSLQGFFSMRLLSPRHHPAWMRRRRRFDHLCLHAAASAGQGLGQRLMARAGELEVGDAAALRHRVAHAGRGGEPDSGAGRLSAEARCGIDGSRRTASIARMLRSCSRRKASPAGSRFPIRISEAKVRSELHAKVVADA